MFMMMQLYMCWCVAYEYAPRPYAPDVGTLKFVMEICFRRVWAYNRADHIYFSYAFVFVLNTCRIKCPTL